MALAAAAAWFCLKGSSKRMANNQLCIRRWTTKHVAKWLKEEGFCDYVDLLCNHHRLDGTALLALTEYDLRSPPLEIKVLGDIKRLMLSIRKLQKQHSGVLEELGLSSESQIGSLSINATPSSDWLCNGELSQEYNGLVRDSGMDQHQYSNGKTKNPAKRLDPEYWKTAISCVYVFIVFGFTSFVMVIVHERVPDMQTYPPLPDIFLDRSILLRRLCSLMGTVFLLRCVTMFVTSLSVPGQHLQCSGKLYDNIWAKLQRAFAIWSGFGMTLTGVHTCGDYMFSGHTVVLTMLNFFVTEYTPRSWNFLHTLSWVLNLFGIFFILAAHEHYSIDVFIAFYITTRLFLYYHTLANTRAYQQSRRARIWFPMFSFFECNVRGPVPNEYCWPFSRPVFLKNLFS
ncbi:sphingomyelin synthase-related protein 1 isoform X3 [Xenopus laevis]|uniref:Sphingomyelin synthase-related protein 1 n=1 Tax=Xenopus laevis TaxID=8355 RepID=A0A8J1LDN7_XENLA|nr:sphingomyelin synthase-related protein 1 isoform X3 [Xenopus laevis]